MGASAGINAVRNLLDRLLGLRAADLPVDLERFLEAQNDTYVGARRQLEDGLKNGHWMWFIFPNWKGLGKSVYARKYAINSIAEAEAYLAHPILGARLLKCSEILLSLKGRSAFQIFGTPDDLKLRSCMTLFAAISQPGSVFHKVIGYYFGGVLDPLTLDAIRHMIPKGTSTAKGAPE